MADTSPPTASEEAVRQLADLGLTWDVLWLAIAAGEKVRQEATRFHPVPAGGLMDWLARVAALRSGLNEQGWVPVDNRQIPLAVREDAAIGVGVLLGDFNTGNREQGPRSKYPKGKEVLAVAKGNEALFTPADCGHPELLDVDDYERLQVWFLVTYRHVRPADTSKPGGVKEAEVRSELSLPGPSFSKTHMDNWIDRIHLPRTRFALAAQPVADGDEVDGLDGMM